MAVLQFPEAQGRVLQMKESGRFGLATVFWKWLKFAGASGSHSPHERQLYLNMAHIQLYYDTNNLQWHRNSFSGFRVLPGSVGTLRVPWPFWDHSNLPDDDPFLASNKHDTKTYVAPYRAAHWPVPTVSKMMMMNALVPYEASTFGRLHVIPLITVRDAFYGRTDIVVLIFCRRARNWLVPCTAAELGSQACSHPRAEQITFFVDTFPSIRAIAFSPCIIKGTHV